MAFDFSSIGNFFKGAGANLTSSNVIKDGQFQTVAPQTWGEGLKNIGRKLIGDGGVGQMRSDFNAWKDTMKDKPPETWQEQAKLMEDRIKRQEALQKYYGNFGDSITNIFEQPKQESYQWQPIDIQVNPNNYREEY